MSSVLLSCLPENEAGENNSDVFTASFQTVTGTKETYWNAGDEITINGYRCRTEDGGEKAVFVPISDPVPESPRYTAYCPADLQVENSTITGTLPQVYIYTNGKVNEYAKYAVAHSMTRTLQFQSLFSFLKVRIMAEGVTKVMVTANSDTALCGDYSADCSDHTPVVVAKGGANSLICTMADGEAFPVETELILTSLPRTLKNGLTFTAHINSELGERTWSNSLDEHTTLYRGKVLDMGDFHYNQATAEGRIEFIPEIQLNLDPAEALEAPISELLFGSFSEMHGGDLVPGICEQYIVNTSFEQWQHNGQKGETKNELVFTGSEAVTEYEDVAYPWERRIISGKSTFTITEAEKHNTASSQMIALQSGSKSALVQRLALPYYRTSKYKLRFYAKKEGTVSMKISFRGGNSSSESTLLSDVFRPTSDGGSWEVFEHEFSLASSSVLFNNRHSVYNLWMEFEGDGNIYIDQVTLFPSDCVEGIFNPETIEYFKQYNVTSIRWPGGNYTSGYNWKDGIGDWDDRPCRTNLAWGGLDSNFLGTDEFIRFCRLTGVEPIMGVGYNTSIISDQDIVDWVQYCKDKGYDVKYWGVGNEVYGTYQLGYSTASSYASGLNRIVQQMRAVDPEITILASSRGVHNHFRGSYPGWERTLYSSANQSFDMVDCHMYVYGNDADEPLGLTGEGYFRAFASANLNFRKFIEDMRVAFPGKGIALLEWGVLPKLSGKAMPTPQRQTFANLLVSACEYHEMIRNSDVVKMAAMHNFSFYVAPHKLHSEPVNMRTVLIRELSELSGGHSIPMSIFGVPTYRQDQKMYDVVVDEEVPELDVVAVVKDGSLYLSYVNRNPEQEYVLTLNIETIEVGGFSGRVYQCSQPYERSLWENRIAYSVNPVEVREDGAIIIPPLSYSILEVLYH